MNLPFSLSKEVVAKIILVVLIGGEAFTSYRYISLSQELNTTTNELNKSLEANHKIQNELTQTIQEKKDLKVALQEEEDKVSAIEHKVKKITNTVGTLEKLSKMDPELLKKYSKVFFLNENFSPKNIEKISSRYTLNEDKDYYLDTRVIDFANDLLKAAQNDDVDLKVASAFRSFGEQAALKSSYKFTYGSGANQFSADQGYSEHQLGTTMDFSTKVLGSNFDSFATSPAYTWLKENAYKYGFILSYPPNNKYYQYEPWHWRFVGIDLATKLHEDNKYFYDMDQREIDKYLVSMFD